MDLLWNNLILGVGYLEARIEATDLIYVSVCLASMFGIEFNNIKLKENAVMLGILKVSKAAFR